MAKFIGMDMFFRWNSSAPNWRWSEYRWNWVINTSYQIDTQRYAQLTQVLKNTARCYCWNETDVSCIDSSKNLWRRTSGRILFNNPTNTSPTKVLTEVEVAASLVLLGYIGYKTFQANFIIVKINIK